MTGRTEGKSAQCGLPRPGVGNASMGAMLGRGWYFWLRGANETRSFSADRVSGVPTTLLCATEPAAMELGSSMLASHSLAQSVAGYISQSRASHDVVADGSSARSAAPRSRELQARKAFRYDGVGPRG